MNAGRKHARLPGRLLMVGFGSVGQAVLLRHLELQLQQIAILAADEQGRAIATAQGAFSCVRLSAGNHEAELSRYALQPGDFLLNLSVDMSSLALMQWREPRGVLYLDSCIEPGAGVYTDPAVAALELRAARAGAGIRPQPPRRSDRDSDPGRQSRPDLQPAQAGLARDAADCGLLCARPQQREDWARLAQDLGIGVNHVAERDTQVSSRHKQHDEFVNTWSVHGFVSEGYHLQTRSRIARDEIVAGMDELGVLLIGHPRGIFWDGSRPGVEQARRLAPYNSATSLQVAAGVLAGVVWALRHPRCRRGRARRPRPRGSARDRQALPG
ncbi:MAG: hypothetical protein RJA36_3017 [Pseudomonadota bacterium]|jgi:homospermidine synthase